MSFGFNPLALVTGAVESACHTFLPKELAFVGDLVGLASDVQSGDVLKGLTDIHDLTQDFAQPTANPGGQTPAIGEPGTNNAGSTAQYSEPIPPPLYGFSAPRPALSAGPEAPLTRGAPPVRSSASGTAGAPGTVSASNVDAAPSTSAPIPVGTNPDVRSNTIIPPTGTRSLDVPTTTAAGPTGSSHGPEAASGVEPLKSAATSSPNTIADTPATDDLSEAAAPANPPITDAAATATATPASSPVDSTSADGFFKLSDKDLMNAVRDGKIPDSVSKDPEQMRRLQMRINDISQMNQLITTMLSTLHDLNKQIIQNLHV